MIDMLEAESVEALGNESHTAAVKWGIDEFEFRVTFACLRGECEGEDVVEVFLIHIFSHELDLAAFIFRLETYLCRVGNLCDFSYDILIYRGCNLCSV